MLNNEYQLMKHEEFIKLPDAEVRHFDVLENGTLYRYGALLTDKEDHRIGYVIERQSEENFRMWRILITDVPVSPEYF